MYRGRALVGVGLLLVVLVGVVVPPCFAQDLFGARSASLDRINPVTGTTSVVYPDGSGFIGGSGAIAADGFIYFANNVREEVLRVDPSTGAAFVVLSAALAQGEAFYAPRAVALDAGATHIYVFCGQPGPNKIVKYNLNTKFGTLISQPGQRGTGPNDMTSMQALVMEPDGLHLLGASTSAPFACLTRFNILSGNRQAISGACTIGTVGAGAPPMFILQSLYLENPTTAIVADTRGSGANGVILSIRLSDGFRTVISPDTEGWADPRGVIADPSDPSSIFVADVTIIPSGEFYRVNRATGVRTLLNSATGGIFLFMHPTPFAVAAGDPHLIGLRGQRYDVDCVEGKVYNLLTDPFVQVNVLTDKMEYYPGLFHEGTFMKQLGLSFSDTNDRFHIVAGGIEVEDSTKLYWNGELVEEQQNITHLGNNNAVTFQWRHFEHAYAHEMGSQLRDRIVASADFFVNQRFAIHVMCAENGRNADNTAWNGRPERSLHVKISQRNPNARPHGLIGQTHAPFPPDTEFELEGDLSDYEIKDGDLFGTSFTFNQF